MKTAHAVVPAVLSVLLLVIGYPKFAHAQDPPDHVGRLSFVSGEVSLRPGGVDEWGAAPMNYPLTTGDDLWAPAGARVEIALGSTAIRLAPSTAAGFLALDDQTTQISLTQGSLQLRIRDLGDDEIFEIDTPNGAISVLQPGSYRVDVNARGDATTLTVREGWAELTAAGAAVSVDEGEAATLYGMESPSYDIRDPLPTDAWERWCILRDRRRDESRSARYVSRDMPGYEDLDDTGDWRETAEYGPVWTPRRVAAGWAPYRNGHWTWIDPWGWTWIDDAPWGFAPFHYGRWVYLGRGWAWVPGRVVARPVYAPALVVFVSGSNWGVSMGVGGGVGWFPLGPHEVYVPAYRVSDRYVRNVNITTVNVTSINRIDVTRIEYRNRAFPGAVTVVTRETFVNARPVGRSLIVVPRDRLNGAPIVGTTAPFIPTRQSVLPPSGRPVRRPPGAVVTRRVVVRTAPPPAPVPFAAREREWQAHPGRPLDPATLARLRERTPTRENALTRPATGGGALRPARRGLPEARPMTPTTGAERRRRPERTPDRARPGQTPQAPPSERRQPAERPAPPSRDDRGRDDRTRHPEETQARPEPRAPAQGQRPAERPPAPALPTPPRLPAEPARPAEPPQAKPDPGRRVDPGQPQPESRPPEESQGRERRPSPGRPQAEPRPPQPPREAPATPPQREGRSRPEREGQDSAPARPR